MFEERAELPWAVLLLPVVFADRACQPCAVLCVPVVSMLSASTFSAALLLFPRSSPSGGVAVGVGVGVGCGLASDAGDTAKQASAAAMSIIADAEVLEDLATRCFCSRSTEVWIRVFIIVFVLYLVLVCGFWWVEISARVGELVLAAAVE